MRMQTPLDVYLSSIGPLHMRIYQTPLPGPLTNVSPFVQPLTPPVEASAAGTVEPQPSSQAVHAPPIPPLFVALALNTLTHRDNVGHAALGEVRTHLPCAGPGVDKDDYPHAAPTHERVVAPNGLELREYSCIVIARTIKGKFEREVLREMV